MTVSSEDKKVMGVVLSLGSLLIFVALWPVFGGKAVISSKGHWSSHLSTLNAFLNFFSLFFLVLAKQSIKLKNVENHKKYIFMALGISVLFLISYLLYHYFHGEVSFLGKGLIRPVYFFILTSHILMSALLPFFVLFTLFYAYKKIWPKHKKIAKLTFPIWCYVNITGILIYFFLALYR